eukprot:CAMPEP_0197469978 /NCGR_PEP_ID=MMETSP1309-20131121/541_1 /TAXON_ID=464262 /ORGANISM="Genus nov. species nov., Strain RCC998" /LENGTH=345 /DNA_ID=CAMNT_0043006389 /DNA_START=421 /DNA_END=1458 /DNA_ORIENTATION=+
MLTRYRGAGQYDITREYLEVSSGNRTSRGFLYKPFQYPTSRAFLIPKPFQEESGEEEGEAITQAASTQVWPGLVFGHGICAEAEFYEHLLSIVASWGYVVFATDEYSDCDPSAFMRGETVNTTAYAEELERNVAYLREREDVNSSLIGIAGHSMGGGASVNAAAALGNVVRAVIPIAPWNGIEPRPSSMVSRVSAPLLIMCARNDSLVPCTGPVTTEIDFAGIRIPFASIMPEEDVDWGGGVFAIYENVNPQTPAILAVVRDANHLTIADSDGSRMSRAERYFSRFLRFPQIELPAGTIVPTIEYLVAFLEWTMREDAVAFDLLWGQQGIMEDYRFMQPVQRSSA